MLALRVSPCTNDARPTDLTCGRGCGSGSCCGCRHVGAHGSCSGCHRDGAQGCGCAGAPCSGFGCAARLRRSLASAATGSSRRHP